MRSTPLRRQRWFWPAIVAVTMVAVAALGALLTPTASGDLDPDSPAPRGTRALAQTLRSHGVRVDVVRSRGDLDAGAGRTIFVADPRLTPDDVLAGLSRTPADVVVLRPNALALESLELPLFPDGTTTAGSTEPSCADPDAIAAGTVRGGGLLYRPSVDADPEQGRATLCYPEGAGTDNGSVAVIERGERHLAVIGQADILRNAYLATDGNAALALRLLGRQPVLQWYIADPAELGDGQAPTLGELMPRWVGWMPAMAGLTVLVVMLWRGRRLGRLVAEPLPVVVRAVETEEGRARLYRQARARDRVAATLRTATLRRLARRFEAANGQPEALIARIAESTGGSVGELHETLLGAVPPDDAALVRLARRIDAIEQDVSAPTGAPRPDPRDGS